MIPWTQNPFFGSGSTSAFTVRPTTFSVIFVFSSYTGAMPSTRSTTKQRPFFHGYLVLPQADGVVSGAGPGAVFEDVVAGPVAAGCGRERPGASAVVLERVTTNACGRVAVRTWPAATNRSPFQAMA